MASYSDEKKGEQKDGVPVENGQEGNNAPECNSTMSRAGNRSEIDGETGGQPRRLTGL